MPDPIGQYDASDQAAVDNQAKEAKRRETDDRETIKIWMSHEKGRDLLFRWVNELCHMGRTFTALDDTGRSDALRTYLDLGERNIGAFIDAKLREHPDLYMKMLKEQQIDSEARNQRLLKQNEKKDQRDGGQDS